MKEYIELGPVPSEESCQQVGSVHHDPRLALHETRTYLRMLKRMFPEARLGILRFVHDFGVYRECVVYFDPMNSEEVDLAFRVEANLPEHWDERAEKELDEMYDKGRV